MNPLESYLHALRDIRSTGAGVKETSYYPALSNLLKEVGKSLKPKVLPVMPLKNVGAGFPDGGLFTKEQFKDDEPLPGQIPARGVIEVKSTGDDAWLTADGEQVSRYWGKYRQVLVTNYRDFVLVGQDAEGKLAKLETYRLAKDETSFWSAAATPQASAKRHGERFTGYLQRVMRNAASIATPEDVAWWLANYARDAKARIEGVEIPALSAVRSALEEALGLKFEGEKGDHFFRSSLVQTLFYGVFSAWVLWAKQHPPASKDRFDWNTTARYLRVPMISKLFYLVADPNQLDALRLSEVLNWTGSLLNRVARGPFFEKFQEAHAVQYFYEPFLEAFDPELRKELGVWYTPPEIVKYMVERVDTVLREELHIAEGLADKNVYVLDPCCGTGSYLVEVLDRIHRTLRARGEDALLAEDLKEAARNRIFGFEILPAPFVVSHLQLGLFLQKIGAPLSEAKNERAGVYLTNALTGWEPPKGPKQHLIFPELEEERDKAEHVKRDVPILVVLGNPPYNAFAGVSPTEEQGLVEPYKEGLISEWGIKKFNLDDLYVRFFRLAERRIAEKTGRGVICFISNFSYLGDPSFVVMRKRFAEEFDKLWFDCLNGDSRETGKLTPDGRPDPSVFSTEYNREGIRLGTAIGLFVRKQTKADQRAVSFRNFWGATKRSNLVASLQTANFNAQYLQATPTKQNRYSFRPQLVAPEYSCWPKVVDLCANAPISGLQEMRRGALMDLNRTTLEKRVRLYLDPNTDWQSVKLLGAGLTEDAGRFDAKSARRKLVEREKFEATRIVPYALYPFDVRLCYYSTVRPLWNEPRPALAAQCWQGNKFFVTRMMAERPHEQIAMTMTPRLPDYHLLRPNAVAIPIRLRRISKEFSNHGGAQKDFFEGKHAENHQLANLAQNARTYLGNFGIQNPDADAESAGLIWMHALAIGYSPLYLTENADGIRQDWPRIPLPDSKQALLASAELGKQIAALLDTEEQVKGVTSGEIRPELKSLAVPMRAGGGALKEEDLKLEAGWGHGGKGGVTMPGKGKVIERDYTAAERSAIAAGAKAQGLTEEQAFAHLGSATCDVYLNDVAFWQNVPMKVWEYTIGGYQVMKKWLSYREKKILGRSLTKEEVREVRDMARRIAAILLLEPSLNENYQIVKAHAFPWGSRAI